MSGDALPRHSLRAFVEREIATYQPVVDPGSYGSPLPVSFFEQGLGRLKSALVEPYESHVRVDEFERPEGLSGEVSMCVVAEDGDYRLAYSSEARSFAALHQVDGEWCTLLWGDPVGCYLAI